MTRAFTVIECDQRSDEWRFARLGRVTSSRAQDMLAKGRGTEESVGRKNLRIQLVLERLTQRPHERSFYRSADMQYGVDQEEGARLAYEAATGNVLSTPGFCRHDALMIGCSPDGCLGDFDELVEIKCPKPATHLEYLQTGVVPTDYLRQITHQLYVTGADACEFISFCPDFPERGRLHRVRITRASLDLRAYDAALRKFLDDVDTEELSVSRMVS